MGRRFLCVVNANGAQASEHDAPALLTAPHARQINA